MTRQQILDLYFMDARSKLIDLAAFLDRVDRGEGEPDRAKAVLDSLSDPTTEPIGKAPGKGAVGAWPGLRKVEC